MGDKNFFKYIDKDGVERLRIKISTTKGRITGIVIQYETQYQQKWTTIVRYDCSHGFFHRDILSPKGEKEKQIISIENLEDALSYAEQD